jgi:hypothetical protein
MSTLSAARVAILFSLGNTETQKQLPSKQHLHYLTYQQMEPAVGLKYRYSKKK